MAHRNRMRLRIALLAGLGLSAVLAHAVPLPPDLSPLSDFGNSDIQRETALISQYGDKNDASIDQKVDVAGDTGHYAEITQTGAGNQVKISQQGDQNRIRVNQDGSGNTALITQNGLRNSVDLTQVGQGNYFESTQIGNDNVIVRSQTGGVSETVEQIGNNLVSLVNPSAASNGLSIKIKVEGNGLTVKQN
ncbi:MAG: hypothetical protein JO370_16490 [Paucibacter sp.]|nr:hypothetical protein [Roseateles sp.]